VSSTHSESETFSPPPDGILSFSTVALTILAPKMLGSYRQRFAIYIWVGVTVFLFSFLVKIFKIKNGGRFRSVIRMLDGTGLADARDIYLLYAFSLNDAQVIRSGFCSGRCRLVEDVSDRSCCSLDEENMCGRGRSGVRRRAVYKDMSRALIWG
jgi:hypothetical protein